VNPIVHNEKHLQAFSKMRAGGEMYKKILVPLDGSPRAEKILPHVEALAKEDKASVILLQTIEPSSADFTPGLNSMVTPQELRSIGKACRRLKKKATNILIRKPPN
jgi:nucleotide-binding universal stress UspA family protein